LHVACYRNGETKIKKLFKRKKHSGGRRDLNLIEALKEESYPYAGYTVHIRILGENHTLMRVTRAYKGTIGEESYPYARLPEPIRVQLRRNHR
jgi:hypothetical protein